MVSIGRATILVRDLDTAKRFYNEAFGFDTLYDGEVAPGLRTVHVGPNGVRGAGLWLMKVTTPEGASRVGAQTAGEPALVFYTDDLIGDLDHLAGLNIAPIKPPMRNDGDASFAHIRDNSGNEIVLVELPPARTVDRDNAATADEAPRPSAFFHAVFGWGGVPDAFTMSASGNMSRALPPWIEGLGAAQHVMVGMASLAYVETQDLKALLASARAAGADILADTSDPVSGHRYAILADPQGETVAVGVKREDASG